MSNDAKGSRDEALIKFVSSLFKESDRGCVVVASSHFEESLQHMLRAYFRASSNATQGEIDDVLTAMNAPIGSFSARTKLAYVLGLIDRPLFNALDEFRRVRNKFVHGKGRRRVVRTTNLTEQMVEPIIKYLGATPFREAEKLIETIVRRRRKKMLFSDHRIRLTIAVFVMDGVILALTDRMSQ